MSFFENFGFIATIIWGMKMRVPVGLNVQGPEERPELVMHLISKCEVAIILGPS